ncbi:MAG: FAD-dependent oxidoreductase [Pseudomonadota bacterium]|nr:FAD-dependent oxidoreductase [Pseudomonadota bacterium]
MHKFDIAIIGGGAAGLVTASVAAQLGYSVVLFEKGEMGGDCLNSGCVPSKALLSASAKGLSFKEAMDQVNHSIETIAPHDSVERFEGLGVTVIQEEAHFIDRHSIEAGGTIYTAKRYVIAAGSTAAIPPIDGLGDVPYLTNESLFKIKEQPKHLIIIGGGPIGCEMADAFQGLGTQVTLIEGAPDILPRDDADARAIVRDALTQKGVNIHTGTQVKEVSGSKTTVTVSTSDGDIKGSHLLLATGRAPNVHSMSLDKAGVAYTARGIDVNGSNQTSVKHIYALGDITGKHPFTHMAAYDASLFIKRVLFGAFTAKENLKAMPWVTYTSPELAQVGLTEEEAKAKHPDAQVIRVNFSEMDRAITEGDTTGFCKVIINKKSRILGATIVGSHAGEFLPLFCYMIHHDKKFGTLSGVTWAYPTRGELYGKLISKHSSPLLKKGSVRVISRVMYRLFG